MTEGGAQMSGFQNQAGDRQRFQAPVDPGELERRLREIDGQLSTIGLGLKHTAVVTVLLAERGAVAWMLEERERRRRP